MTNRRVIVFTLPEPLLAGTEVKIELRDQPLSAYAPQLGGDHIIRVAEATTKPPGGGLRVWGPPIRPTTDEAL